MDYPDLTEVALEQAMLALFDNAAIACQPKWLVVPTNLWMSRAMRPIRRAGRIKRRRYLQRRGRRLAYRQP